MLVDLDNPSWRVTNEAEGRGADNTGAEFCLEGRREEAGDVLAEEEDRNGDQRAKIDLAVDVVEMIESLSELRRVTMETLDS